MGISLLKICYNALNAFLYNIKRQDSPNCIFCNKEGEILVNLFCECEKVTPLWNELLTLIHLKVDSRAYYKP